MQKVHSKINFLTIFSGGKEKIICSDYFNGLKYVINFKMCYSIIK